MRRACLVMGLLACGGGESALQQPDASADALCDPGPAGPLWFVEGDEVSISVSCETGYALPGASFSFEGLPAGATYAASTQTIEWIPGLDQAAVYTVSVRAEVGDEQPAELRLLTIGIADAYSHPDNIPVADPLLYPTELGLPVFFLDPVPDAEEWIATTVTYGRKQYLAEAKLRGASSLAYPKKNFALRFGQGTSFSDREKGFENKDRVTLTSTFDDNSYIRQRMAYDLWTLLDPTIRMQAYSAVVYIDGQYHGLYTITDFPDDDLMESVGLNPAGNLFKAYNHDANFRDTRNDDNPKATLDEGYQKNEGTPVQGQPGAFDDLIALVQFVVDSDDTAFGADIANRIAVDDYAAWWLLATFTTASDSAGKNSYHHHDPSDPDSTWTVVPWDFNHSFGQTWTTARVPAASVSTYFNRNRLFERLRADPIIGPAIASRYQSELLSGVFSKTALLAQVDAYIAEIDSSAVRDWAKWEDAYRAFDRWSGRSDFTTYQEEVAYLRTWIAEHWDAVVEADL